MSDEPRIHPRAAEALWWQVGYSIALSGEELIGTVPIGYEDAYLRGQAAGFDAALRIAGF